jgi:hypothetical protein
MSSEQMSSEPVSSEPVSVPESVPVPEPVSISVPAKIHNPTNYDDISLNVVQFDPKFLRNRGTLSQIIKSFSNMGTRLTTIEPLNDYQKGLYPFIASECTKIVDAYSQLLNSINNEDYSIFGYYINGPYNDGKRKPTTTRHEFKSYVNSEYKESLRSTNDRLRHIKIDCVRKLKEKPEFQKIIDFCDEYHKIINTQIEVWDKFITEYRISNNITKPAISNIKQKKKTQAQEPKKHKKTFKNSKALSIVGKPYVNNNINNNINNNVNNTVPGSDIIIDTLNGVV